MKKLAIERKNIVGSLAGLSIALMVCAEYLAILFGLYGNKDSGYYTVVIVMALICAVCYFVLNPIRAVRVRFVAILVLVLLYFGVTRLFFPDRTNLSAVDFFGMCILPMVFGCMIKADYRKILTASMLFLCFGLPVFNSLFLKANAGSAYDAITMGNSYAMLPAIGAGIIHFFFFRKESGFFEKIMYVVTLVYLLFFIGMSYRGALISLFMIVLFAWILSGQGTQKTRRELLLLGIVLLLLILYLLFGNQLLYAFYSFLENHNIKIAFIDKTRFLAESSDIAHGRREIWSVAWRGFWESPFWGHGMTTFKYYTGYVFPHNFILQFLFDGGILLAVPLLGVLIKGVKDAVEVMKKKNVEQFAVLLLLFISSVPRLMVSAEVWRASAFWLMMGMLCGLSVSGKENCVETVRS